MDIDALRDRLRNRPAWQFLRLIADDTGLSLPWLKAFHAGHVGKRDTDKIACLRSYFAERDA